MKIKKHGTGWDSQVHLNGNIERRNPVLKRQGLKTSLMAQWLRIHLAMQGTQVGSLVGKLRPHRPTYSSTLEPAPPQLESPCAAN